MKNQQILFIDSAVKDFATLARSVKSGIEAIAIDPKRDGVEQIVEVLENRNSISTIHIVSHGQPGSLQLGSGELNSKNIEAYSHLLQKWSSALRDKGEILLYGCNVAAESPPGTKKSGAKAFVQRLSQLTRATVAASENLTGFGGDWVLGYNTNS